MEQPWIEQDISPVEQNMHQHQPEDYAHARQVELPGQNETNNQAAPLPEICTKVLICTGYSWEEKGKRRNGDQVILSLKIQFLLAGCCPCSSALVSCPSRPPATKLAQRQPPAAKRRLDLSMGAPKQRWTSEEEAALRAGIAKHGVGNWRTILKDPEFSSILHYRSNVDLKDKWRNINVFFTGFGSREKRRAAMKKNFPRATPKNSGHSMSISTVASDVDDEIVDPQPILSVSSEVWNNSNLKNSQSRLDNIIMESVKNLNEPTGSHRTTIASYIEEQFGPPSENFDHILSAKLKDLTTSGKLIKVNRAPSSLYSEGRSSKILLLEDVQREPQKIGSNDSKTLTKSQVYAELERMATMTAEEAASTAARAVSEAEALMAEAEAAAREAEMAEADAQAAQAFAEAALLTLKNRHAAELMAQA